MAQFLSKRSRANIVGRKYLLNSEGYELIFKKVLFMLLKSKAQQESYLLIPEVTRISLPLINESSSPNQE